MAECTSRASGAAAVGEGVPFVGDDQLSARSGLWLYELEPPTIFTADFGTGTTGASSDVFP